MAYTALAYSYWASFHDTYATPTIDINYNCHIKAIELIWPVLWGLYHTTSWGWTHTYTNTHTAVSILRNGLDDNLRNGLVFYGHDFSVDNTIFYRTVVDRLEMYLFFCKWDHAFRPVGLDRCSYVLSYFTDGMDCVMYFADETTL